jgi:hypothetical protein
MKYISRESQFPDISFYECAIIFLKKTNLTNTTVIFQTEHMWIHILLKLLSQFHEEDK